MGRSVRPFHCCYDPVSWGDMAKSFDFPVFKTKIDGEEQKFALEDPAERARYFMLKAGPEIEKLRTYLTENTFVAYLLGKKNSGKGTYSKLFAEAVGIEYIRHISVGDIVRSIHEDLADEARKQELINFLKQRYRGFLSLDDAVQALLGRDTATLLPTEFTLALVEREISKTPKKALFIDGFPRDLDQVSYSLYFRALIGYRDDPDFFVFIDVPEAVIDERITYRVICPRCHTPRSIKLLRTKEIGYDESTKQFYLICENAGCAGERMVAKEGDSLGIETIRKRLEIDDRVMRMLQGLQGVPKVFLRNSVPVSLAKEYVDDYEVTPAYRYRWDAAERAVHVVEEPWMVNDDDGMLSYSLLPAAVAVSFMKQTANVLGL